MRRNAHRHFGRALAASGCSADGAFPRALESHRSRARRSCCKACVAPQNEAKGRRNEPGIAASRARNGARLDPPCPARGAGDGLGEDFKEPHEVVGCHSHASRWPRTRLCGFMPLSVSQVHAQIPALSFLDFESKGQAMHATGLWRNGSASDYRSEGWEFESLWPHFTTCAALRWPS